VEQTAESIARGRAGMNVPATARTGQAARALAVDALVAARARVAAREAWVVWIERGF